MRISFELSPAWAYRWQKPTNIGLALGSLIFPAFHQVTRCILVGRSKSVCGMGTHLFSQKVLLEYGNQPISSGTPKDLPFFFCSPDCRFHISGVSCCREGFIFAAFLGRAINQKSRSKRKATRRATDSKR